MKATFFYADLPPFNSSHYRVLFLAKYLKLAGHEIEVYHTTEAMTAPILDTVLVERDISLGILQSLRDRGAKRIVYTFDDAYRYIPNFMPSFPYWRGDTKRIKEFGDIVRKVDLSICPSRLLAREYHCSYVPNYHDPDLWKFERPEATDEIVIGWGGSTSHALTWQDSLFSDVLASISKKFKVKIVIVGGTAETFLSMAGVKFESVPWMDFNIWPRTLATFTIGIAPLVGPYDQRRSNIKAIEYGLAGIPFVGSGEIDSPYEGCPGGFVVGNNTKDWVRSLQALIESPERRAEFGNRGKAWASRYLMPNRVMEYQKILWPEEYKGERSNSVDNYDHPNVW